MIPRSRADFMEAVIDVCRKRFDVVLMNPPFGEFSVAYKGEARTVYPNSYNDIFGAFIERFLYKLAPRGLLGAITSRAGFFLTSFTRWREEVILKGATLRQMVDLGAAVMDEAMVESAAYCLERTEPDSPSVFIRLLGRQDRATDLVQSVLDLRDHAENVALFKEWQNRFRVLPSSPFAYWASSSTIKNLAALDTFTPNVGEARQGLVTGDNPRFVRTLWEVSPSNIAGGQSAAVAVNEGHSSLRETILSQLSSGRRWVPHVMAGASQPWFSPFTVLVNWENDGQELKNFKDASGKLRSRPQNMEFYFRPGFSWTLRAVRLMPYLVPAGAIASASRYMAFPSEGRELEAVGVIASNVSTSYLRFYGEWFTRPKYLVETVKALPWPILSDHILRKLEALVTHEIVRRRRAYQNFEPFQEFTAPSVCFPSADPDALAFDRLSLIGSELDRAVAEGYGLDVHEQVLLERDLREAVESQHGTSDSIPDEDGEDESNDFVIKTGPREDYQAVLSYAVGCIFGRWDIRIGRNPSLAPKLPGPFDPVSICPLGMLLGPNGLPATSGEIVSEEWLRARPDANRFPANGAVRQLTIPDASYPLKVDWDGILVDDPEHSDDLVQRVVGVLSMIWENVAEERERDACDVLAVKSLRDYFRRPGKGGFWLDHVDRYSKSRRKSPIYWILQSSKRNFGLWLYYHRFDADMLFKALVNYVEPKLRLEDAALSQLREERLAMGTSGREVKQVEQNIARQTAIFSELSEFRDKLLRAANLRLTPDLNDGVVLNMAPLWELVPWDEPKKVWNELLAGQYEWSSIGQQLRTKGLVK